MRFELDRDINALYIRLRPGDVTRTIELTDSVYADLDAEDAPLGIEFINADEFVPFLRDRAHDTDLPPRVRELFRVIAAE
jgi:uncharacterized protein YuzE